MTATEIDTSNVVQLTLIGKTAEYNATQGARDAQWRYKNKPGGNPQIVTTRALRKRNRARISAIKVERGCADCGYNARPEALDFDHLPGQRKDKLVSKLIGNSWDRIEREIAKCEVVCANCHRIRTADRKVSE